MASSARGGVLGRRWPVRFDLRVAWLLVLAALVMTLAALAVAVGSRPSLVVQVPDGPGRIVFVRDGDLFVAEIDGSGQTLISSGDAGDAKLGYLTAAWSPDLRHIAAVRDVGGAFLTPGVDLLTADGALVRTVALDPGPSEVRGPLLDVRVPARREPDDGDMWPTEFAVINLTPRTEAQIADLVKKAAG